MEVILCIIGLSIEKWISQMFALKVGMFPLIANGLRVMDFS